MKDLSRRGGHPKNAGFSLIEVLVAVAIVGVSLAVLLGASRLQIRSVRSLRPHSEARVLLEQAVDRFQYGDGADSDSLIKGEFAEYQLSFLHDEQALPVQEALRDPRLWRRRVTVSWTDGGQESKISLDAWRFSPDPSGRAP